jgi:ankyrin repeat protein
MDGFVVKLLVELDDVDADLKDEYGQTPLSWAAWYGHGTVAKLLMEWNDVDAVSKDNQDGTLLLGTRRW